MTTLKSSSKINSKFTPRGLLHDAFVIDAKILLDRKLTHVDTQNLEIVCHKNHITIKKSTDEYINVIGSSKSFSDVFGVTFTQFESEDKTQMFHSHTNDITIPSQLNFISDILGFNNMPCARPYFVKCEDNTRVPLASFTPLQLAKLYKFPTPYNGKGQTIGIIELGGGYLTSDLTKYFQALGLTATPKIVSVSVDGGTNNPYDPSGASLEVVLDIEVAGAIANASTIVVYFAPNTFKGFYDAISKAINDTKNKPSIISISWGAPESYWSVSTLNSYNSLFATAARRGINVFCAAGDNGSTDGVVDSYQHVDFPSSSPNVIACGGTKLVSDGTTITSETVWNNNNGQATGGGFSSLFNKPTYQNGISSIQSKRGVPDVAGNADPVTGYNILMNNTSYVVGGTSAVAPLWAGLTARLNQSKGASIGFANPGLYTKKPCTDITVGNNGAYTAAVGWDACTGLGSPNGLTVSGLTTRVDVHANTDTSTNINVHDDVAPSKPQSGHSKKHSNKVHNTHKIQSSYSKMQVNVPSVHSLHKKK